MLDLFFIRDGVPTALLLQGSYRFDLLALSVLGACGGGDDPAPTPAGEPLELTLLAPEATANSVVHGAAERVAKAVRNGFGVMPAYDATLSAVQIEALALYVSTVTKR